jgi:hypothetical protein
VPVARWRPEQIAIAVNESLTDEEAGVWTFTVNVPGYTLRVMGELTEVSPDRKKAVLSGVHVEGAKPNEIGVTNLRMIGDRFCEVNGYDELVVQGGIRTTGASPGRVPGRLRFKRGRTTTSATKPE